MSCRVGYDPKAEYLPLEMEEIHQRFPPLGLCALCAPDGTDALAPPWVILQLHPAPLACPATFSTCERPPRRHQNVGYWSSKRRKCPLAGGHGSDLQSRPLLALGMLGDLEHKSLGPSLPSPPTLPWLLLEQPFSLWVFVQ